MLNVWLALVSDQLKIVTLAADAFVRIDVDRGT